MAAPTAKNVKSAAPAGESTPRSSATVTVKRLAMNLAERHKISMTEASGILDTMAKLLVQHLKNGDRVRFPPLGTLKLRKSKSSKAPTLAIEGTTAAIAYAPTASAYEPSARGQALLRGKEICEKNLEDSGGAYALEHVENLLGISRQAIDKKVRDGALLAIPGPHGRRRYPVAQFTMEGVLPGLPEVLKSLPSANAWFRLNFLVNPASPLGGRRPIDLLQEGAVDPVVKLAEAIGIQGA